MHAESWPLQEPQKVAAARRQALSPPALTQLSRIEQIACEPARLAIVHALRGHQLAVNDLAAVIGRQPAATSQHLRVLRQLGVVESERRGTVLRYRLCPNATTTQILALIDRARGAASGE